MKTAAVLCLLFLSTTFGQDVVQVICTETSMTARIQKELVENAEYSMEDLHLNDDTCTFDVDDGEFFEREISPITSCGTSYTANETHVEFTNSISTVETGSTYPYGVVVGSQSNARVLSAVISCTYRIDLNVSTLFIPNITIIFSVIQMPDAFGAGEFRAAMAIYEDASYLSAYTSPPIVDADETLYIGVTLLGDVSDDIYLLMEDCWGTVSDDPDSLPKYPLIGDGCPVTSSGDGLIRVTQNGIGHQGLWNSPVFKFVGEGEAYDNVWLHCDLQLCINAPCEPTCSARRKRRSLGDGSIFNRDDFVTPHIISLGPIRRLMVTHISSNDTKTIYIQTDEELNIKEPDTSSSSDQDSAVALSPIAIGIIAAISVVALLCLVIAMILVTKIRGTRSSGGVDLGGITNKAFT